MTTLRRFVPLLAAALAVAAGTAFSAPAVNQLENGGFEDFDANNEPAEWEVISGNANPTSDAAEGSQAVVLTFVGTQTTSGVEQDVDLERQDAVVPNAEYDLAFEGKLETSSSTTPATANATIIWRNALGEPVGEDVVGISQSDTYVSYDETFRAPPDATAATIQFELDRPSTTSATNTLLKVDGAGFGPSSP